jgi:hypothetical protein
MWGDVLIGLGVWLGLDVLFVAYMTTASWAGRRKRRRNQ